MRASVIAALAALAAGAVAAGVAVAQSPDSLPTYRDVGLEWKTMPKQKHMDRHYPIRAAGKGIMRGYAKVACTANAQGRLKCRVVEEDPQGVYFGYAALQVMQHAEVKAVDGGSPEGRTFGYGLRFGNWSPWDLPDGYHPSRELRWASMPKLGSRWNLSRQNKGETFSATFDCTARADGSLDCTVKDAKARNPDFVQAAHAAMSASRVERADGRSPEGSRFEWEMNIMRTSFCAGGRHTTATGVMEAKHPDEELDAMAGGGGDVRNPVAGGMTFTQPPRCRASFVHVRD